MGLFFNLMAGAYLPLVGGEREKKLLLPFEQATQNVTLHFKMNLNN